MTGQDCYATCRALRRAVVDGDETAEQIDAVLRADAPPARRR
jgi:hypothetical protein